MGYEDESTVAKDITEDDLDDESDAGGGAVRSLGRDKRGNIIRTCGIAGCQYKTSNTAGMKYHKAARHGIDVVWFSCDQDGCDYKAKEAGTLKAHKANVRDIDVRWHHCDQDGCDYKAKKAGHLKSHERNNHKINDPKWNFASDSGVWYVRTIK
ncbi:hypothetical protein TrST_g1261 [Triparma strigata]|uniref:C2H2-type domain-containing protein n=1 Tax=Triparma strigata TaxID=1606541 RepID=A0A9W6ZLN5_9STRA|nr:hypothetical protein TrST_g1261 [Triparma strigata]